MKVIVFYCAFVVYNLICFTNAQLNIFDWDFLNDRISEQVQDQVYQINSNFNDQISSINTNLESQMTNLNTNLAKMQENLSQIGSRVQQEVQSSMEPLNAMKIQTDMAHGIGGITIATFGDRFTVIFKNGKKYACSGDIIDDSNSIRCTKTLTSDFTKEEKICTDNSYSRVNNIFCFGDYISLSCVNNACTCSGGQLFTLDGLKKICSTNFGSNSYAKFVYYPDESNMNHIQLPNPNKYVLCAEGSDSKCTWYSSGLF